MIASANTNLTVLPSLASVIAAASDPSSDLQLKARVQTTRAAVQGSIDDYARVLGHDHVTGPGRALRVHIDDPLVVRNAFASPNGVVQFSNDAFGRFASADPGVIAHELFHVVQSRLLPRTAELVQPGPGGAAPSGVALREHGAISEGLADVGAAIHTGDWHIGNAALGETREFAHTGPIARNAERWQHRIHGLQLGVDIHAAAAPVSSAFHGISALGREPTEALFAGTMASLVQADPDRLTYRSFASAMRSAAAASGSPAVIDRVAQSLARVRL